MRSCKRSPRLTEKQAHDSCAEFHVRLPLASVHVGLRNIADVMQPEAHPQARVPGEAVQFAPCDREEPGVQHSAVRTVQDGSRSNSHRCLRYSRTLDRFAINLPAVSPSTAGISAADSAGSVPSPTPSRTSGIARRWETYSCTASRSRGNRSGEVSFANTSPTSRPPTPTISGESLTALDTLRAWLNGILWSDRRTPDTVSLLQ